MRASETHPAQILFCVFSGRPHRQQQALPEHKQQLLCVAANCACPRDTLARGSRHQLSWCCGTPTTPSCAYRLMSPRMCRQGRVELCLSVISVYCFPVVFLVVVEAVPAPVPNPKNLPIEAGGSLPNNTAKKRPTQKSKISAEENGVASSHVFKGTRGNEGTRRYPGR